MTWASPLRLVGLARPGEGYMASRGFLLISKSGRIQVICNQYQGIDDVIHQHTRTMDCVHSDDMGQT